MTKIEKEILKELKKSIKKSMECWQKEEIARDILYYAEQDGWDREIFSLEFSQNLRHLIYEYKT